MTTPRYLLPVALLVLLAPAACNVAARKPEASTPAGEAVIPPACVAADPQRVPFFNLADGYCLQHPVAFALNSAASGQATFFGPPQGDSDRSLTLTVEVMGPARGRSAPEIADDFVAAAGAQDAALTRSTAFLGQATAEVVDGLPGVEFRHGFLVHDDTAYHLSLAPPAEDPQVQQQAEQAWTAVLETISFLPPAFAATHQACPKRGRGAAPYLNLADGYCLAYPATMTLRRTIAPFRQIVVSSAGPTNRSAPAITLAVSANEPARGRTAEQVAADRLAALRADPAVQLAQSTVTIGGEPAVVVDGLPGQWLNRMAFLVHDGLVYELLISPFGDPDRSSDQATAEALWQTVVDSFVFLGSQPATSGSQSTSAARGPTSAGDQAPAAETATP